MNDRTTLDCRHFARALEAARDAAPDELRAAALDRHADGCAACAGLLAAEAALRRGLTDWRRASARTAVVPPGFARRVTLRARDAALPRVRTAPARWGFALGAAACLAVAVVLSGVVPGGGSGPAVGTALGPVIGPVLGQTPAATAHAGSPAGAGDEALGPLLWSNGRVDIVAPAGADFPVPQKTATTALLVEYRF